MGCGFLQPSSLTQRGPDSIEDGFLDTSHCGRGEKGGVNCVSSLPPSHPPTLCFPLLDKSCGCLEMYSGAPSLLSGVLGTGLPGLGTEHLPGALCSGTGSPALGLYYDLFLDLILFTDFFILSSYQQTILS